MAHIIHRAEELGARIAQVIAHVPKLNEYLLLAEEKSGVHKNYIALGACAIGIIVIFSTSITTDAVGTLYPLYMSIRAIEYKGTQMHNLITYWLIFFATKLFDSTFQWLVAIIPFYAIIKCMFYVWCYHPTTKGSAIIMNNLIKPYVTENVLYVSSLLHGDSKRGESIISENASRKLGYHLLACTIKKATMTSERSVCCEVMLADSEDANSKGFIFTTDTLEGSVVHFNYCTSAVPMQSLKGFAEISLIDKPTFGKNSILGTVKFELSRLVAGAPENVHFSIGDSDVEVIFELNKDV